jgi:hypothetical protein
MLRAMAEAATRACDAVSVAEKAAALALAHMDGRSTDMAASVGPGVDLEDLVRRALGKAGEEAKAAAAAAEDAAAAVELATLLEMIM